MAVLYHLLQAFCEPGDEVVYAWRSFEAYPIAVAVAGAASVQVPLTADARHDLDAMAAAVTDRTKVVIVCTPEQPDRPGGHARPSSTRSSTQVPSHVLVVVDEAYREFVRIDDPVDGAGAAARARQRGGDAHLRQGLRAGRLPGRVRRRARAVAAAVRACALPFGVSSVAQAAAVASLARRGRAARAGRRAGRRARPGGRRRCAAQGWDVPDAQGNFVWFALGDRTADFAAAADEAGIMVRPFAGEGARVTIGEPEANDLVIEVAGAFRS